MFQASTNLYSRGCNYHKLFGSLTKYCNKAWCCLSKQIRIMFVCLTYTQSQTNHNKFTPQSISLISSPNLLSIQTWANWCGLAAFEMKVWLAGEMKVMLSLGKQIVAKYITLSKHSLHPQQIHCKLNSLNSSIIGQHSMLASQTDVFCSVLFPFSQREDKFESGWRC